MRPVPRVLLVYNTDYDDELKEQSGADVSAVQEAARAARQAAEDAGLDAELVGVHGHDIGDLVERLRRDPPDVCFNLCESLHGDTRNEQVLPALLDLFEVPYTGPDALAIGLCLHKDRSKYVLSGHGIATPAYLVLRDAEHLDEPRLLRELEALEYPFFVKLVREDASIGIEASNVVADAEALVRRTRELFARYGQAVLAERYIEGREVNVTVLGNEDARVLPLHEIDFGKMPPGRPRIVSYAAKWDEDHVDFGGTVPVPMRSVDPDVERAIGETSIAAFHALGLRDFGRVDLRIDEGGQPWVIDVNPNCDLSPDSGAVKSAAAAGLTYPMLIRRICELALERHGHRDSRAAAG